jgi:2-polyprenyl-6-methoxyphenol hydroxylase-like FAD-dependent oxidoreductase
MPHSSTQSVAVLVVGAGPTGLVLASELFRHGVPCRIVEKNACATDQSRATDLQPRMLEVLYAMGLLDEVAAVGHKLTAFNFYASGERLGSLSLETLDSPYPWVLGLPQYDTEGILERHLERLGGRVERSVELAALGDGPDGVTCTLLHPDRTWEKVRADWVVACDGANSTVRQSMHLSFDGTTYDEHFVLADVRVESDLAMDAAHGFYGDDGHTMLLLPMPGERNVRLFSSVEPGDQTELSLATFEALFSARTRQDARLRSPGWMSRFRVHKRMVDTYRRNRVFLAGDAAHIHSPVTGQGMNLGMQDAYNLAWKLALVVRGRGRAEILDSYEPERLPLAKFVLDDSDRQQRIGLLKNRFARVLRNQVLELVAQLPSLAQRLLNQGAQLSWNYRGSPLVAEDRGSVLATHVFPDRTTERASLRDWLDFSAAPAPGDRAPDVASGGTRLFELLRGTHHSLVLFDGRAPTASGYEHLAQVATSLGERHGADLQTHIVVFGDSVPASLDRYPNVVLDAEGSLHARYGAGAECAYLIRPDGYVGYRSMPADDDGLRQYLSRVFV